MIDSLYPAILIASGGTISVGSILIVLFLLSEKDGLRKGGSYLAGYTGGYLLIGLLFITIGTQYVAQSGDGDESISIVPIVLGLLFLFLGVRTMVKKEEVDAGPPKIFKKVGALTIRKTFLLGGMVSLINFKNLAIYLSAVSVIVMGEHRWAERLLLLFIVLSVFCAGVAAPLFIYLLMPTRAEQLLSSWKKLLEENQKLISTLLLFLFGILFISKGLR